MFSRVFAVLIGIDTYQHVRKLRGCVNDCNAMSDWLKGSFDVVRERVLINDQATRANILKTVKSLSQDLRIQENDLILIFFAGHGAEVKPLEEWKLPSKRKIQMRIPYDFKYSTDPEDETYQAGILDRDFSRIIAEVAREKGENIVVIFDSCYSASGTRSEDEGTVRSIKLPDNYAKLASLAKTDFTADVESNTSRASSTTPTNHILLAACREDLTTRESRVSKKSQFRGNFTRRLLEQLELVKTKSTSVTYEEIILSLGYDHPFPHCDGVNKDRIIFTMNRKDKAFLPIELVRDANGGDQYRIQLGLCHNIKQEDEFLIFKAKDLTSDAYVGEAKVTDARNLVSYLKVPTDMPDNAVAVRAILLPRVFIDVQSEEGRIEISPWISRFGVKLVDASYTDQKLVLVQSAQDCVEFNYSPPCEGLAKTFLHPSPEPPGKIDFNRLFQQMGHFYDYLECATLGQESLVEVKLVTLVDGDAVHEEILTPNGTTIPSDKETLYGYKITNTSCHPVYFSLFYFDMLKFSIDIIYNPPTVAGGEPSPCLEEGESKTIGYGNEGDVPYVFYLEQDGVKRELMYLKLFFSTAYLDLLHIRRDALFLPKDQHHTFRGVKRHVDKEAQLYRNGDRGANDPIGTLKIPLICARKNDN